MNFAFDSNNLKRTFTARAKMLPATVPAPPVDSRSASPRQPAASLAVLGVSSLLGKHALIGLPQQCRAYPQRFGMGAKVRLLHFWSRGVSKNTANDQIMPLLNGRSGVR